MKLFAFTLLSLGLVVPVPAQDAAHAFDAAWSATWKIMPGTNLPGELLVIAIDPDGKLHRSRYLSSGVSAKPVQKIDAACDGTESPSDDPTFSWSCEKKSDSLYELIGRRKGQVYITQTMEVAPDGQSMSLVQKSAGRPLPVTTLFVRFGGTAGLAGAWTSRCAQCTPAIQTLAVSGNDIRLEYRDYRSAVDGHFDGTKAPWTGTTDKGWTIVFTRVAPLKIHFVEEDRPGGDGREGDLSLDNATTTMTEMTWWPGQEDTKATYTYQKQP